MAMGNLPPFEEQRAYGGFFPALVQTWIKACFNPAEFFQTVGNNQAIGPALLFGMLVMWLSIVLATLSQAVIGISFIPIMGQRESLVSTFASTGVQISVAVLSGWIIALLNIVLNSLIVHLFLLIFGGAQQGLKMTLRVISYASAPYIFSVVPFIGGCVAVIWTIILAIIGLCAAHRTDTWRAVLAVVTPPFVCGCLGLLLAIVLGYKFASMS